MLEFNLTQCTPHTGKPNGNIMTKLRLYSRPECHLCEAAESLLESAGPGFEVEVINIEEKLEHLRRYGIRIPVVQRVDTGAELGWPFDRQALQALLN